MDRDKQEIRVDELRLLRAEYRMHRKEIELLRKDIELLRKEMSECLKPQYIQPFPESPGWTYTGDGTGLFPCKVCGKMNCTELHVTNGDN